MPFPSNQPVPYDKQRPVNQSFQLEYRGMPIGILKAHKVPNPQLYGRPTSDLYKIDYLASDRSLQDYLAEAVARWLNGTSRRTRAELLGSEAQTTPGSPALREHLAKGVLFLRGPQENWPAKVCYVPRDTKYPYQAPGRYDLAGFLSKLGVISSIK